MEAWGSGLCLNCDELLLVSKRLDDRYIESGTEALFRAHADFVARFVVRLGVAANDVDDVVQEVFLVAHHQPPFDSRRGARSTTYLGAIAMRAASSYRRRQSRIARRETPLDEPRCVADPSMDPARAVELSDNLRALQSALDRLDEESRGIFILFELEGESCRAIAEAFQLPIGTVYSRLHTARARIRKHLRGVSKRSGIAALARAGITA